MPSGTSPEFTHLLHQLLKRDAKDRISFEDFISHPFLAPPEPSVPQKEAPVKTAAAKAVPERARIEGGREEGCLPPSPAVTQVLLNIITTHSPKSLAWLILDIVHEKKKKKNFSFPRA